VGVGAQIARLVTKNELGQCSRYGLMRSYTIDFKSSEKNYGHIWNTASFRSDNRQYGNRIPA